MMSVIQNTLGVLTAARRCRSVLVMAALFLLQIQSSARAASAEAEPPAAATPASGEDRDETSGQGTPVDAQTPAQPLVPPQGPGFQRSHGLHCDVLEHLKTPRTYRRLDAYMRPTAFAPRGDESAFFDRDYLTGDWGGTRTRLYDKGIEIYGCWAVDMLRDIVSNVSDNPLLAPPPVHDSQIGYTQVYGLDLYSPLWSDTWEGGQLHLSVAWPETRPIYAYRNRLNPTGTSQIHGHFYTDIGLGAPTDVDQGIRLFELWFQQQYGPNGRNYVRVGNIFPVIQIARSIVADLFNFWTFTEPCMLGTTYFTGNAPCYPQAPLGVQVYHILGNNTEIQGQIQQGYYGATGRNNRRGIKWDLKPENGIETMVEFTYKGGTYSLDPSDMGKPWFIKIGVQLHSGLIYSVYLDQNNDPAALTDILGVPRQRLRGNAQIYVIYERMLYREPGSYGEGLTMFAKVGGGFYDDRNVVKRWYASGVGYEGLFPDRERDVLFGGWAMVRGTDGFVSFQSANEPCRLVAGCVITGRQDVIEAGYSMEITPWLQATPMVQYIRNPNTRSDLGDLFSAGIATRVAF